MTSITRSTSLILARTGLAVILLSFAVFVVWTAGDLLGQAPAQKKSRVEEEEEPAKPKTQPGKKKRVEEEEEAPRKQPKRKVIRVEGEDEPKVKAGTSRPADPAASGNLTQLAEQATHPAIKALCRSLAIPYDLVLYKSTNVRVNGERMQREERAKPIPIYLGNDPGRFGHEIVRFTPYTLDWKEDAKISREADRLESITPYEKIAQDKVRKFLEENTPEGSLDSSTPLTQYEKLVAAGQVLKAIVRWHDSARRTEERSGKEWDEVETALRTQFLDVSVKQMEALAQTRDWELVLGLAHRLTAEYTNTKERERIFQPVAGMVQYALTNPTVSEAKRQDALRRLHELEREFPDSAAFRPLAEYLKKAAESEVEAANALIADKKYDQAEQRLLRAQELWPQLEKLPELERVLNLERPTLKVGVRGPLPKYFSPARACTDTERRILDMLFESLVKRLPDEAGGYRYAHGLSESDPRVVSLGRQFELPRKTYWSDGKRILNATDIGFSLKQLQEGKGVGRSRAWGDFFDRAESKKDLFQVTLQMRQGFFDLLAPMTFKILPRDQRPDVDVNSEAFARDPVTSGPFRVDRDRQSDEKNRECRFFVANPYYRLRPSKRGAPHLQEVRFYSYSKAAEDADTGKLDLMLDLTAEEAQQLERRGFVVPLPSNKVPNRRIYFLAINTKKLEPYGIELRRAISSAIDRETLLTKHFRGPLKKVHKALAGPFPAGSWACKRNPANKGNPTLFDPDTTQLLKEQQPVRNAAKDSLNAPFRLKYTDDHPALGEALKDLCDQVKALTGVVLEPTRCSPQELREAVEQSNDYQVAYYHYDFPDDTYWLGPLFGKPPEAEDDQNIFRYQPAQLTRLLDGVKSFRNFAKVQEYQWETQELLNREMPFVPLWQLDPLLAYRRDVQPKALDPLQPFSNLEEWHLLRK